MRRTSLLVPLAVFVALPRAAAPQAAGTVTGLVTTVTGVPLSAAAVSLPGTGIGTLTNEAGRYLLLDVPAGEIEIRVDLVGHRSGARTITVAEGAATVADFTLTATALFLDEIVVTGTGRAFQKKQLGNTVATLDAERLSNAPVASFTELLQAREPSVVALTSDGATGSGARIRIRGSNSVSMSNEPIVYVDGIRVDNAGDGEMGTGRGGDRGSRLDDINWEAVQRVEILKGAAAATLYGSEASSGVIQIFTKAGRAGASRMTARAEVGTATTPDVIPQNAGFARDAAQAAELSEVYGETLAPFEVFERDFTRDMLERGDSRALSADVSGGDDRVQYYLAGRYAFEDGTLGAQSLGGARDELSRIQGNASMTFLPREGLRFRLATGYTDSELQTFERNNNIGSPVSTAMAAKPERATCAPSAVLPGVTFGSSTPVCTGPGNPWGAWVFGTPRENMQREMVQDARHFSGSLSTTWEGGPGLSVQALVGLDQVDERFENLLPFGWRVDGVSTSSTTDQGVRGLSTRAHREVTLDAKIGWSADLGEDVRSELVAGAQRFFSDSRFSEDLGAIFPAPGIEVLQAGEVTRAADWIQSKVSLGGYVQEQIGYRDWIFVTVGARFDRTSAFGRDAGAAFYPKAGISAIVSDLASWPLDWLPTLRLRAALGKSGLQPGVFDKATTYFPAGTPDGGGIQPGNLGNPALVPERSTEVELGAEGELLEGRVGFDVTYWDRATHDALVERPYPAAGGFTQPQLSNIGRLDAHGWELQVDGLALDRAGISLNLFANAAYTSELVTSMGGAAPISVSGTYTRHRNVIQEGLSPGSFLGARMIPVCGTAAAATCYTPGSTVPFDSNGDGVPDDLAVFQAFLTSADAIDLGDPRIGPMLADEDGDGDPLDHYLGKPTPDWQGSFGADLTLGSRLSIGSLFEYRAGNYTVSNLTRAFRNSHPTSGRNTRATAETESTLMDPATRSDPDARLAAAMRWANELAALFPFSGLNQMESGDFVRWRELSVMYRLPDSVSSRAALEDVTVTLTGRNLAIWTAYGGSDPEANELSRCGGGGEAVNAIQCNFLEATDTYTLPLPRRFALSVRVVF